MAVLTRTPLLFTGVFFFMEAITPTPWQAQGTKLTAFFSKPGEVFKTKVQPFLMGAAPLAIIAMVMNQTRFGFIAEFGHRFFEQPRQPGHRHLRPVPPDVPVAQPRGGVSPLPEV